MSYENTVLRAFYENSEQIGILWGEETEQG